MKVLQINKFLKTVGGAETYMFQLSKALKDNNIEVKYWGMHADDNDVNDFPKELLADTVDYNKQGAIAKVKSIAGTIYSSSNRKKIGKVLDAFKPDIVHIHNYNFQLSPSILPEIKKRRIPIVQTIHDSQMICPYHRLFNFQRNEVCTKCVEGSFFNCIKDKCFDGSILKSTIGAAESMLYHSLGYYEKHIDFYISPSNFLAELVKKRIKKDITVIPNFTDIVDPNSGVNSKNYYLYFGRISEEKGVLELIELFKDTQFRLVLIGKGPLEDEVAMKIKSIDNIEFVGPKYGSELFGFVEEAKYVIQPSKWFENCPMTIIESFALNTPVIGSNHSGFKDLIDDGKTGWLLDFSNFEEAKTKLLEIDKITTSEMKKNILEYYSKYLSKDIHIKKILKVYKKLLEK
ncbi:hypothetical protein C1T31_01160 [Hanstruepera neustonica]|uniref:Glycosyltransferase family 1 protein n=1 Tax=Hanstruepera neustonica TaxID=1445657 RepID=A0A2K1E3B2_9FLAO|nr:glycosyltransferase family 4 protein [Hanstruepera neustonica]PNQ74778.1 hypothetical protein C1T31_01160 [Hanstruepera neustonica]